MASVRFAFRLKRVRPVRRRGNENKGVTVLRPFANDRLIYRARVRCARAKRTNAAETPPADRTARKSKRNNLMKQKANFFCNQIARQLKCHAKTRFIISFDFTSFCRFCFAAVRRARFRSRGALPPGFHSPLYRTRSQLIRCNGIPWRSGEILHQGRPLSSLNFHFACTDSPSETGQKNYHPLAVAAKIITRCCINGLRSSAKCSQAIAKREYKWAQKIAIHERINSSNFSFAWRCLSAAREPD